MKSLKVLIACEESQTVCKAFRKLGHEAYSCDIQECSGGHPEWHLQEDIEEAIYNYYPHSFDLTIFHPPCTALAVCGNRWYGKGTKRHNERIKAIEWTLKTWRKIKFWSISACLENPLSVIFSQPEMNNHQYIQPWQFGHGETKKTGLELYNLPELKPTKIVSGREQRIWKMGPSPDRKKLRSKTYQGIAEAMATQWSEYILNQEATK